MRWRWYAAARTASRSPSPWSSIRALDTAVADERKFRQILLNLLSNAVKFTPEGGAIVVAGTRLPERDRGFGQRLRHRYRARASSGDLRGVHSAQRRPASEGTGLGLALAKKLVELHGGAIRVESALGQGAKFTFSLPQPEKV